jgi:prepilin-type N-terminal cleavage/methylation domain-containing protein
MARIARRGFSLAEILVVVAVIGILVGLLVPALQQMQSQAKVKKARTTVQSARAAADAYRAATDTRINSHEADSDPFDWSTIEGGAMAGDFKKRSIERLIWAATQVDAGEKAIEAAGVGDAGLTDRDGNGFDELRDPWGTRLIYASYAEQGGASSEDDFLPEHGTSKNWRPFVASAGPDGLWGGPGPDEAFGTNDDVDQNGDGTPDHEDNIYSYEMK